jgi:single-strand DNA-binding protein
VASYNRIVLVGNLTRDPQLSYTPSNTAVCKFGIATNRRWKDRDGKDREDVCFVDCTIFGRAGETFNQYMRKGRTALVEGRLQLNQWTTQEGDKRSKHEVLVENFTFLDGGNRGGGEGGRGGDAGPSRQAGAQAPQSPQGGPGPDDFEVPMPPADDIPF